MSHYRCFALRTGLCALLLLALTPMAQASVVINYSVADPGPFQEQLDTASLPSFTGGSATLIEGVAQTLQIGTLAFNVVYNSAFVPDSVLFNVNRVMTINTISGTLLQDLVIATANIADTASVTGGSTTRINLGGGEFVDVTTNAYSRASTANTLYQDPIYATFLLHTAPEPGSLSLLAIGALGMFGASRKRKQDKA